MNILKKLGIAAVAVVMAVGAGQAMAKEWKTVRVGTEGAYPPFNTVDASGKLVGFDIDIADALCDKMKVKCTFVAQDWDGIIPGLLAKKYDAIIASMTITEERKKRVDFTDKYYTTPAQFIVKKGSNQDVSPAGLKGKNIGAQKATTTANYLEDMYKGSNLKFYDTQEQVNLDLMSGRLDAMLPDKLVMLDWLAKEGSCCEFTGPIFTEPKWFGDGIGIAVRKGDPDLTKMLNKAIAEIVADGTYAKINAKYFPFSIY